MSSVSPYQEFSKKGEFFQTLVHLYIAYSLEHKPSPLRQQNKNFPSSSNPLTTEKEPILTSESCTQQEKVVIWPKGGPRGWAKGRSLQVVIMKAKANVERTKARSTLLNVPMLCTTKHSFALANHHWVYSASPKGFQEAPKLWHIQGGGKKKQLIKFPWCQFTG